MKSAFKVGLSLSEYEELTPRELNLKIEVWKENNNERQIESIKNAFYSATFVGKAFAGKLKPSDAIRIIEQIGKDPNEKMSDEKMLNVLKQFVRGG
jgi:hypothetical protein